MIDRRLQAAALVAVLAGAAWFTVRTAVAQEEASPRIWEFATVEAFQEQWVGNVKYSAANVCYHTTNGCRWDTIRVTVDRWGQINDAVAAATARLGERGWEPVGLTQVSDHNRASVLLKQLRPAAQ